MKRLLLIAGMLLVASSAFAQSCPKVVYSTPTATLKSLVAAVNCLTSGSSEAQNTPKAVVPTKNGIQVETFQIVGPQHSHPYSSVVLAVLSVPTGSVTKTAVVTPDAREATVTAEAGGSCSVKINLDKTVDSRCYIAGGTVYVVYR
jgi:hypothetical protein